MESKKEELNKINKERSIAYPALNLEKAIDLVTKLRHELGKGPYSREDAVKGLGYGGISGASQRAVAALVHYGLLTRSGNVYSMSDLVEEILHPTDETGEKKKYSIMIAAKSPKLFQKIIDRFKNQPIPGLLENILIREGVSNNYAKEVASILKDTLEFSGILQKNGVIIDSSNFILPKEDKKEEDLLNSNIPDFTTPNFVNSKESGNQPFTFSDSGNGWNLFIKSTKPLNSEIKKSLIDISDSLKEINENKE